MAFTGFFDELAPFPRDLLPRVRDLGLAGKILLGTDSEHSLPLRRADRRAQPVDLGDDWLRAVCWGNPVRMFGEGQLAPPDGAELPAGRARKARRGGGGGGGGARGGEGRRGREGGGGEGGGGGGRRHARQAPRKTGAAEGEAPRKAGATEGRRRGRQAPRKAGATGWRARRTSLTRRLPETGSQPSPAAPPPPTARPAPRTAVPGVLWPGPVTRCPWCCGDR